MTAEPRTAFYCVADERYFLGAVAMINSLRHHGHDEPIYLLDCGLSAAQHDLLEGEVELVAAPAQSAPYLLKTIAPLRYPAEAMVLIDADMIVTRPLGELIEQVRGGGVLAFCDRQERYFAEWGELLGADSAIEHPYVSSGFVALGGTEGRRVIELMEEHQDLVEFERTFWRGNEPGYPFLYADQDVLNAILAAGLAELNGDLTALDRRLAATPPFRGLRLLDQTELRCAYEDGTEPFILHQFVRKPWLEPMYHGIYSRLLARLLIESDVAIRVPEQSVPLRLRHGFGAQVDRTIVNARDLGRFYLGDRLPGWIGGRIESWRRGRAGERRGADRER